MMEGWRRQSVGGWGEGFSRRQGQPVERQCTWCLGGTANNSGMAVCVVCWRPLQDEAEHGDGNAEEENAGRSGGSSRQGGPSLKSDLILRIKRDLRGFLKSCL